MLLCATVTGLACVAPTERVCVLPANGPVHRNPDATVLAAPLLSAGAADSLGIYTGWIALRPDAALPEHVHAEADEIVFVTCGGGQMIIGSVERIVTAGTSVRIPRGARHTVMAGPRGAVAVQIYRPGGPGTRFYDWEAVTNEQ